MVNESVGDVPHLTDLTSAVKNWKEKNDCFETSGVVAEAGASSYEDSEVTRTLNGLKNLIRTEKLKYVKEQIRRNMKTVEVHCGHLRSLATSVGKRNQGWHSESDSMASAIDSGIVSFRESSDWKSKGLLMRSEAARFLFKQYLVDSTAHTDAHIYPKLMPGNYEARKIEHVEALELEAVQRLPPYTAWIFVARNERMANDQSVAARRRISYESNGRETFFCTEMEEQFDDVESEANFCFSEEQDFMLWMTVREHGSGREVMDILGWYLGASTENVEARLETLRAEGSIFKRFKSRPLWVTGGAQEKVMIDGEVSRGRKAGRQSRYRSLKSIHAIADESLPTSQEICQGQDSTECDMGVSEVRKGGAGTELCTTLALSLDSFNSMFCRRCLLFNCQLHGCFQDIVDRGSRGHPPATSLQDSSTAALCSAYCHLRARPDLWKALTHLSAVATEVELETNAGGQKVDSLTVDISIKPSLVCSLEQKKQSCDSDADWNTPGSLPSVGNALETSSDLVKMDWSSGQQDAAGDAGRSVVDARFSMTMKNAKENISDTSQHDECSNDRSSEVVWKRVEKDLCEKGVEIFGKNSCLIARNMLKGWKTCEEIAEYLCRSGAQSSAADETSTSNTCVTNSKNGTSMVHSRVGEGEGMKQNSRTGMRRKIRFGKKKVAPKSAVPAIRKRIEREGGRHMCRQYTPCSCEGCGKECPCLRAGTFCEKYCGCLKSCKNRFRGCQCAKSLCESRHCPCFAADRECDPDICRFCEVECGEASVGPRVAPSQHQNQTCHNMSLLHRNKKRILLGQSSVAGWGVFANQTLVKNDFIGEYTGELISHNEADRRGRVYDRETSFLFNLNDKLVLDAFRRGDKLKFANHSARKPNCYTKVLMVGGDHRVGIFAKERIQAGEELFYDYQYEPEIAPIWATGPDS